MDKTICTSQVSPDRQVIDAAADILLNRGVAIVPTDSVYGIGCAVLPDNVAFGRIYKIKQRPETMKLPWLISNINQFDEYAKDVPDWAIHLAQKLWPGALTLVVKASERVPDEYKAHDGTIALRMPDSNLVRDLIDAMGCPLAATSANLHGRPSATNGSNVDHALLEQVDIVINAGEAPVAIESTIVDCTGVTQKIVRQGALSAATIEVICSERSN